MEEHWPSVQVIHKFNLISDLNSDLETVQNLKYVFLILHHNVSIIFKTLTISACFKLKGYMIFWIPEVF